MLQISGLRVIHCVWQGPFGLPEAISATSGDDYGIYAIYGVHAVHGANALLYIGQSNANPFAARLSFHNQEWVPWEPSAVIVHLGRIAGWEPLADDQWGVLIDDAEALLIFYSSPAYNSSRITAPGSGHPKIGYPRTFRDEQLLPFVPILKRALRA